MNLFKLFKRKQLHPDTMGILFLVKKHDSTACIRGRNIALHCPYHKEKTPSFMISVDRGAFLCFGCGKSGTIKELLAFLNIGL